MNQLFLLKTAVLSMATLVYTSNASATLVVAGWDAFSSGGSPTVTQLAAGVTATASNTNFSNSSGEDRGSSSDTTWGSFDGNGVAASSAIVGNVNLTANNAVETAQMTMTIVNNGTVDLELASFHMDALAFRPNAPRAYALNVLAGSNITVGNVFTSADDAITSLGTAPSTAQDQHDEIDISLSGLADSTLGVGETAIIQIAFSSGTGSGGGHHLWVDNVAVSGAIAAVPEASLFGVWALSSVGIVALRRKEQSV